MKKASTADTSAPAAARFSPADSSGPYTVQMKPRGRLFVALLIVFALWFTLLVWMYLKTVKPVRPAAPVTGVAVLGV